MQTRLVLLIIKHEIIKHERSAFSAFLRSVRPTNARNEEAIVVFRRIFTEGRFQRTVEYVAKIWNLCFKYNVLRSVDAVAPVQ